jgi:hypothetical protein
MAEKHEREANKADSATTQKGDQPKHHQGDQVRKAQEWGGGSKGAKGPITADDKHNPNSSSKA